MSDNNWQPLDFFIFANNLDTPLLGNTPFPVKMIGEWNLGLVSAYYEWTVNVSEWDDGTSLVLAESEEFQPGSYHCLEFDGPACITASRIVSEIANLMDSLFDSIERETFQ